MAKLTLICLGGLLMLGSGALAQADTLEIRGQVVRRDGSPLANLPLRVVVGTEQDARAANAGARLTTDAEGRFQRSLETEVTRRFKSFDTFIPHRTDFIEIGIELDLLGRPALYWIELDHMSQGVLGGMGVFLKDSSGRFRQRLKFHPSEHSWSFPDQPDGVRLSGMGAELRTHDAVLSTSADGRRQWTVDLKIEKDEFKVR